MIAQIKILTIPIGALRVPDLARKIVLTSGPDILELSEFCLKLPTQYLTRIFKGKKLILRETLRKYLPPHCIDRPKRGFNLPINVLLRNELYPLLMDTIRTEPFASEGPFNLPNLEQFANDHKARRADTSYELFSTLVLALWWNSVQIKT